MTEQRVYETELEVALRAAIEAGETVRDLYERAAASTYLKADGSPVTDADMAADRIIRAAIGEAFPDDILLTEEGSDDVARLERERVWIIDPIDGTQQFIDRNGEFDVLIALAVEGRPVVGVALRPPAGSFLAAAQGLGAWTGSGRERRRYRFEPVPIGRRLRLGTSVWLNRAATRLGLSAASQRLGADEPTVTRGGTAAHHLGPAGAGVDAFVGVPTPAKPAMGWEWDFAAADMIVHEAGGSYTDVKGRRFRYNKPVPRNQGGLVASVDPATHQRVLRALEPELAEID